MLIGTAISLLAAEASYSITFIKGSADNTTAANTGNFNTSANIKSGQEYIESVTACTKIYPHCEQGLKFGSSKSAGKLTFTLANDVKDFKVTRIVLTCTKYNSDTGQLKINENEAGSPPKNEGTLQYEYTTPAPLTDGITIETTSKRAYVSAITVYYEVEAQPLGNFTASINGIPIENEEGVMATVPAKNGTEKSSLTVSCANAESIALENGETWNGDTFTLPIEFTNGEVEYNFTASNSYEGQEPQTLYVYLTELGVPVIKDGETNVEGNTLKAYADKTYTVFALNAETVLVKKDGVEIALGEGNTIKFEESGNYVITATAGKFTTTATYKVAIVNVNTPKAPVVMLNGVTLTNGETYTDKLLNSKLSISCVDATGIYIDGANGDDVLTSYEGEFVITKPGKYTFQGTNENAPEGQQDGEIVTITFEPLTLSTPEIRVGGKAVEGEIILPVGGGEIELFAADADGNNAVASFDYQVNGGEKKNVTDKKTLHISEIGTFTYTFTAYADAEKTIKTSEFTATITVPKPEVYVRANSVKDLYEGAKVIIVCEDNGYAAGTKRVNALIAVDAGITKSGKWTYNNTDVGVFVLERTGDNQYAFKCDQEYLYAGNTNSGTGIMKADTQLEDKFKFNVGFDANGVILNPLTNTKRRVYFYNTQDVRTYENKNDNAHYAQLYVIQTAPEAPTLTVREATVTEFTQEIMVKVGDEAVFSSKGATSMMVKKNEEAETKNPNDEYKVTFAESDFTDGVATYTVSGVNETGESEKVTVTFKLDLTPVAPVVKKGEQVVEGNAVDVLPGDEIIVTAAEGTTLVYTKNGAETPCDGNIFSHTFTTDDYIIGEDGTVSKTPVVYTFKAKKDNLESEVVTLNVTVKEPTIFDGSTYRLVTSNNDLQDGKKYVLMAKGENMAAKNTLTSNKIDAVSVTPENDMIKATTEMMVFELEWLAESKEWRIKTNNLQGHGGYQYIVVSDEDKTNISFTSDNPANLSIKVEDNSSVDIRRTGSSRMILYHNNCFGNYASSNRGTSGYADLQLYVMEGDEMIAGTFEEFRKQSELHPGREVKFVEPLTVVAHIGGNLWMKDKADQAVYASYDRVSFENQTYLMNELTFNYKFWNFSGKVKHYNNQSNAPVHVDITSIDVEYELSEENGDKKTGKVPYIREPEKNAADEPVLLDFNVIADPEWWTLGKVHGTLSIHDGVATFTTDNGKEYKVLTDLAKKPASSAPRRYAAGDSHEWDAANYDDTFFVDGSEYSPVYMSGAIMPNTDGSKAIMAMKVSSEDITTDVETVDVDDPDALVDVYNMQGMLLRSGVRRAEALRDLPAGIYIAGGKKVLVKQ